MHVDTDFSLPLLLYREPVQPVTVCSDGAVSNGEDFTWPDNCRKACKHTCTAAADQCSRAEEPNGPADVYSVTWYGCLSTLAFKKTSLKFLINSTFVRDYFQQRINTHFMLK